MAVALSASVAVAIGSYILGDRWARAEVAVRYEAIRSTLSLAAFPLNRQVITSIGEMTNTQILAIGARGQVIASSDDSSGWRELADPTVTPTADRIMAGNERLYRYGVFVRQPIVNDRVTRIAVLFDENELRAAKLRAAALPLATGLSTVLLLTSVTLLFASRLIRRLADLQSQVNRIAEGDFETSIPIGVNDEVGKLGSAVTRMSGQLQQMWATLQRQQGEKLLHQVAGGLAHQLRNSITGARMAMELHEKECHSSDDSLFVALGQIEQTEQQIRRLLQVAAGSQGEDQPQTIGQAIEDVRPTLESTAKHLGAELRWTCDAELLGEFVQDGPSLSAAISNLVLNSLQVARQVDVSVSRNNNADRTHRVRIDVFDNGPGPSKQVADEIFQPFVSSKPEGLGLGLPLVARSAQRLGGSVEWGRQHDQTRFTLVLNLKDATE